MIVLHITIIVAPASGAVLRYIVQQVAPADGRQLLDTSAPD